MRKNRQGIVASCYEFKEKMSNYDKISSFRFSESVYQKLDDLMDYYAEDAKRIGGKPKNKTEIVEEAIKELYFKMINTTQDGDVVDRVNRLVNDQVNVKIENLQRKVDRILYLAVKNDFGNKLVYRSPSIIPPPPDMDDAIEIIVDEESGWDNALEEYLMSAMKNDDPGENE